MKIWECEIVEKEGDQYHTLKAQGWEPHQFTLIPVPKEAQTAGGLLTANGQSMGAAFVQIVMMRKQVEAKDSQQAEMLKDAYDSRVDTTGAEALQAKLGLDATVESEHDH